MLVMVQSVIGPFFQLGGGFKLKGHLFNIVTLVFYCCVQGNKQALNVMCNNRYSSWILHWLLGNNCDIGGSYN